MIPDRDMAGSERVPTGTRQIDEQDGGTFMPRSA